MEGFTLFAVISRRIVLALADVLSRAIFDALGSMAVTFTSPPYRQVGHGVVIALPHPVIVLVFVIVRVQFVKDDHDVCRCNPVLENGVILKIVSRRATL